MKDHEKAALVGELTKVGKEYGHTQQLRARLAEPVLLALNNQHDDALEKAALYLEGTAKDYQEVAERNDRYADVNDQLMRRTYKLEATTARDKARLLRGQAQQIRGMKHAR